ncbi:hypothetical protein TREMEDRAFT_69737 [Tremella mesenterica DSM 1558]|uniref:uncharacterized protein n=1 Tax=Tremella mesenterica (strain ATCC 24925 / CBS 8224 / DSM 1558 / NBRC 9311 / NRRL Y-6157 / RJB 2259-6 / UBC 559-6) TaxID=578456 RepID=UPI0003F49EAE|nr:uncharacterized protein TREMEDRAFT_69737 [Tremella mesenterica DSM 1558]EIW67213.1 hypothetical protein TREMEDRAFT_69737 [Tremella mesenterica DSM 1558]
MRVFVTGASGWVAHHLIPNLLTHGHTVLALSRSPSSDNKILSLLPTSIPSSSLEIIRGSLTDLNVLSTAASTVDAIAHLGFNHDFSNWMESIRQDVQAIKTMSSSLSSGKSIIIAGGLIQGNEMRGEAENFVFSLKEEKGINGMVMRLPSSVHGKGDYAFVPYIITKSKELGFVPFVQGAAWAGVHVKDAAELYRIALENPKHGILHAVGDGDENISTEKIAETIAKGLGLETKDVSREEAQELLGFIGRVYGANIFATAKETKEKFGWQPKEIGLLEDIKQNYLHDGVETKMLV